MKPDWTYIDSDIDIESFIANGISELDSLCSSEKQGDPDSCFEQLSHTKFALEMLLQEIHEHKDIYPCVIVVNFARKMDQYSCENLETSCVFSAALDAAQGILSAIGEYA